MSRTKGYKCYNIQCGSCIGKTLCGEPGDAAPWCQDRVFDGGIQMDYKNLVEELNRYSAENQNHGGITAKAADAITDLLARAEAAEKENSQLNGTVTTLMESNKKLADALREAEARAEKAERERDAAVNDLKEEVMGKIWACEYCKKNDPEDFQCKRDDLCGCSEWEWRGQKEE